MIRYEDTMTEIRCRLPRTRGDDPAKDAEAANQRLFAPHARG